MSDSFRQEFLPIVLLLGTYPKLGEKLAKRYLLTSVNEVQSDPQPQTVASGHGT